MPKRAVAVGNDRVALQQFDLPRFTDQCVHIRTLCSLVSQGTELATIRGVGERFENAWTDDLRLFGGAGPLKTFPVALGYSCVGRVSAVGPAVAGVKEGDTVWLDRPHQDEHIISASEALAGLCREDVDPRRYGFRVLAKVALAGVHDAHPYLGATAAVIGLGIIGQITVELLRISGAARIFAVDPNKARHRHVRTENAEILDGDLDPSVIIKQATAGGVDTAIETSGTYEGLATALRCVSVGGRVVSVSTYSGPATALRLGGEYHRNRVDLISSMSVNDCPHRGYPAWSISRLLETARNLLDDGAIAPEQLISRTVPFAQLPDLYRDLLSGRGEEMAILITYDERP